MALLSIAPRTSEGQAVDFLRDIQPILAEKCWHCHGADQATRQGGLRLDVAEAALEGGDSGKAIVPGQSGQSLLISRILSTDSDELMPPAKEAKPLTSTEKKLLASWIDQGAGFATHWAFEAPRKRPLPETGTTQPVDAWVRYAHQQQKLQGAVPAEEHVRCRRLYLDLIGLPPTLRELEEYVQEGHDATIDKLLKSPRFGEKWARHWLDVARYSDTNGYEKDLQRDQWIWRDWVVNALNKDMPYDQFVIEQIAGDLLPGATQEQLIATGFLRNSMLNEEGAIVPEQFRMVEMFDRIDCIGKAVLGLSAQCAQCHAHKFDPISQSEYYGMFAFLNNAYEAQSWVYDEAAQRSIDEARAEIARILRQTRDDSTDMAAAMDQWRRDLVARQGNWKHIGFVDLGSVSGLNHPVQLPNQSVLMLGHSSADVYMTGTAELTGATGLRLELLTHGDLPFRGPGRSKTGTWTIHELEFFTKAPGSSDWTKQKLIEATADFSESEQSDKDGKKKTGPVRFLIDGADETSWQADRGGGLRNLPSVAVMQFEKPLETPPGTQLKIVMRMGSMVGCARFGLTRDPAPQAPPVLLAGQDTDVPDAVIETAFVTSRGELKEVALRLSENWSKLTSGFTSVLHLSERQGIHARATHFLERGSWDQPGQVIQPHTPRAFHPLPEGQAADRLAFARWLVDRRSALAARVAVNRIWQAIFGEGLVETAEDFGTRAPIPEHRELLDWLAVELMDQNWSQKHLIKLIVGSATYQQSSHASLASHERDPKNRWLSRGPRFRADAEVVRDIALSVSGLMTHKLGGPSIIPPVPQNVLDYNYVYPAYWKPATGPDRYRRTLYGFRKRSMPDPVMSNFDGPNGDFACARRVRSNTPLAALTGLNETIFFECAQALGLRVVREGGTSDQQRIDYAYRLCTSRGATRAELIEASKLLDRFRSRLADGWLNPREIVTGDPGKLPTLPEGATPQDVAAWVLTSRVLLNLDETITKN